MQRKAKLGRREAAAEAVVIALDQADHIAFGVGGGQVNSVTSAELAGREFPGRALGINQFPARVGVFF